MSVIDVLSLKGKLVDDFLLRMLKSGASDELYEIVKHQVAVGGKRLRPALTILCCEAVGGDTQEAIPAAAGVELIHNYTLIFDDIIDRSDLRRGQPTVRAKYGDAMAILAGMHYREAIFEAAKRTPKSNEVDEVFSVALRRIIEGERLDVLFEQAGRQSEYIKKMMYKRVNEKIYSGMIEAKTAELFKTACKVGAIVGNGTPKQIDALSRFGWNCGIAFQIVDDILDIIGEEGTFGKEIGKDIKEHKLGNLIILYGLKKSSKSLKTKLLSVLSSPNASKSDIEEATKIILSTNAVKRAYKTSKDFIEEAKADMDALSPSEAKDTLLRLADFVVERKF